MVNLEQDQELKEEYQTMFDGYESDHIIDFDQKSELGQVLRVTTYVLRFIKNCKNNQNKVEGPPTTEEIHLAKF